MKKFAHVNKKYTLASTNHVLLQLLSNPFLCFKNHILVCIIVYVFKYIYIFEKRPVKVNMIEKHYSISKLNLSMQIVKKKKRTYEQFFKMQILSQIFRLILYAHINRGYTKISFFKLYQGILNFKETLLFFLYIILLKPIKKKNFEHFVFLSLFTSENKRRSLFSDKGID